MRLAFPEPDRPQLSRLVTKIVKGGTRMAKAIQMPHILWKDMHQIAETRLKQGGLKKPIVFALYTEEHDHGKVTSYREIPTVKVIGDYPDGEYRYVYPGIKAMGFYPRKSSGKWFSGTVVVGGGLELDEEDKKWMIREQLDFRIKMDIDSLGRLSWNAYFIDFPMVSVEFQ
jgi:hypothetical protein